MASYQALRLTLEIKIYNNGHFFLPLYKGRVGFSLVAYIRIRFFGDGSNNVQSSMFDRSKPKIGCLSSIAKR